MRSIWRSGLLLLVIHGLGCGGAMPKEMGLDQGRLRPCPESPNCVSSSASDELHRIEALAIVGSPEDAWQGLVALLEEGPRIEIVSREPDYLHAVFTSKIMRFRDDGGLHLEDHALSRRRRISAANEGLEGLDGERDRGPIGLAGRL